MSTTPANNNSKPPLINQAMVLGGLRILLGMAAATAIGAKYPEVFAYVTANLPTIVPEVTAVAVFVYGVWTRTRKSMINSAANLPGATVVLDNHAEAASINNASVVPSPAIVVDDKKAA